MRRVSNHDPARTPIKPIANGIQRPCKPSGLPLANRVRIIAPSRGATAPVS